MSGLNYANEDDDFDAQGNNPAVAVEENGDVVFAFEDNLYGYSEQDQEWKDMVTLNSGYSTDLGSSDDPADGYSLSQTGKNEHTFSFAANTNRTEYQLYQWQYLL